MRRMITRMQVWADLHAGHLRALAAYTIRLFRKTPMRSKTLNCIRLVPPRFLFGRMQNKTCPRKRPESCEERRCPAAEGYPAC